MNKIFIAGAGGIGEAVAIILREWSTSEIQISLGDINDETLAKAKIFVTENSIKTSAVNVVQMKSDAELTNALQNSEIILDCLPGDESVKLAKLAQKHNLHYVNLTERVSENDEIIKIANESESGFILQTGLAPGFINLLAISLYRKFVEKTGVENVERIAMKVGALSQHAHEPHFYAYTWSPIGVAAEYIRHARLVRNFEDVEMMALTEREKIIVDGNLYEADLTSGGAADLPEFFKGKARNLDYKTLRYVGHYDWIQSILRELPQDETRLPRLSETMKREIPHSEDDFILIHASVEGFDKSGARQIVEKSFRIEPMEIGGQRLRAIQTTTAAPLAESAMMLLSGNLKGAILQSQIDPETFLNGNFVSRVYGVSN